MIAYRDRVKPTHTNRTAKIFVFTKSDIETLP